MAVHWKEMPHRGNLEGMERFLKQFPGGDRQEIMEEAVVYAKTPISQDELALFMKLGYKPCVETIMTYLIGGYYGHLDTMVVGGWKPSGRLITEVSRFYDREIKKKPRRTERYERRRLRKVSWLLRNYK